MNSFRVTVPNFTLKHVAHIIKSQFWGFVKHTMPHHNFVFLLINHAALVLITVNFITTRSSASLEYFRKIANHKHQNKVNLSAHSDIDM